MPPPPLPPKLPSTNQPPPLFSREAYTRPPAKRSPKRTLLRWIVVIGVLAVVGFCAQRIYWAYGVLTSREKENIVLSPGEAAFREADRGIIRYDGKVGTGNHWFTENMAADFSASIKEARELLISQGNKKSFSLSRQQFLTYCRLNRDSCVFLVHVPELRRYTADAKDTIVDAAWTVAHRVATEAGVPTDATLVVGVKGVVNYEAVYIGGLANRLDPSADVRLRERGFDLNNQSLLYEFFSDSDDASRYPASSVDSALLPAPSGGSTPATSYKDYAGLLGENLAGNVFLIRAYGRKWAAMSIHQFDGDKAPTTAMDPDAEDTIALASGAALRQLDAQVIPITDQAVALPHLDFDPLYELESGEDFWIQRGADGAGTIGKLLEEGTRHGRYSALDGPTTLVLALDTPVDARGASGLPIIRLKTGMPVGVLIGADDGKSASKITFEPICMAGRIRESLPADEKITALIAGAWRENFSRDGSAEVADTVYSVDGTYVATFQKGKITSGASLRVEGRWQVRGGLLQYDGTSSNDPDYPKDPIADQLVELGEDYLIYRNDKMPGLRLIRKVRAIP